MTLATKRLNLLTLKYRLNRLCWVSVQRVPAVQNAHARRDFYMTSANYLNWRTDKEKEILWCDYGNTLRDHETGLSGWKCSFFPTSNIYIYIYRIFLFVLYSPRIAFANCGHKLCKLYLIWNKKLVSFCCCCVHCHKKCPKIASQLAQMYMDLRLECYSWGKGHIQQYQGAFSDRLIFVNRHIFNTQTLYYLEAQANVWVVERADSLYFLSHPKGPKAEIA